MSTAYQKLDAYRNASFTVSKTRQIVMLYDGIVRFLQQAKCAMTEGRIEDRFTLLSKASAIVTGLQGCLDFEQNAEVSTTLYDYYAQCEADIFSLQRTSSVEQCDLVIAQLKTMREAWNAIDASYGTPAPAMVANAGSESEKSAAPFPQAAGGFSANEMQALMISA